MLTEQPRRDFLKSMAIAGLSYALGGSHVSAQGLAGQDLGATMVLMNGRIARPDERRAFAYTLSCQPGPWLRSLTDTAGAFSRKGGC
jgi:hypothetical protein